MLVRLILIAAIVAVFWYLLRHWNRPSGQAGQPPGPAQTPISRCLECGVHAPENAGVRYQDKFFCSPEHLQSWMRKNNPS